ncbi:MAG TPA: hypothetical protein DEP69_05890, partial [Acidimicrobiaceae bacterium]|nr:hypothetical protein [Acidimicrobiaceae bacterium]
VGVGAAAAAAALVGGLESKRVAIEGFGAEGLAIARAVAAQGATVARVAAGGACVSDGGSSAGEGLTPAVLADAWLAHGDDCVAALGEADGVATEKPSQVWSDDVDVIFCGSKPAALTGEDAKTAGTTAVVSWSPAAISSRALAVLRSAGAPAAADFVAALGPTLTWWADPTTTHEALRAETAETVASVMAETAGHDDGAVMAACYRAERFMETWIDELPFGRPLG